MNMISLGDFFTGLSVLVSAAGIGLSQAHDRRQRRREARAVALEITLQSISAFFEDGLKLAEKIKWAQVGEGTYTDREIMDFAFELSNKIRCAKPRYSVWSSEKEQELMTEMEQYTESWRQNYARYLRTRENIPSFSEFLEKIEDMLTRISKNVRDTL